MGAAIDRNSAVHQKIDSLEIELSSLKTAHNEASFNFTFAHSRLIELQKKIASVIERLQSIRQGQLELETPVDVRPQD
jgi:chromosome segregation ATPase